MFSGYKISNNVLYLYVDYRCEIGSIFNNDKKTGIVSSIKKFIKDHKIKFDGTKVILLLSGLMIGTVYLNNDFKENKYDVYPSSKYVYNIVDKSVPLTTYEKEEKIENIQNNSSVEITNQNETQTNNKNEVVNNSSSTTNKNTSITSNNKTTTTTSSLDTSSTTKSTVAQPTDIQSVTTETGKTITLKRTNGQILKMDIEEYLVGVVAAEMPASFNTETLKAQAIVARTYTLKLLEQGRTLTDDVSTQVYKSNDELQSIWQGSYSTYYNKIKNAVDVTKGIVIKYNGSLIDAVYHSTSNGYTEDSVNVWGNSIPYLKTVTSPWDTSASSFLRTTNIPFEEISSKLGLDFNASSIIEIISRDESNRITKIKINDTLYSGVQVRNLLGLRSADFDVTISDIGATFTTRGYGHGVGMSQYGANGMANSGYNYEAILKYYYTGVDVIKVNY